MDDLFNHGETFPPKVSLPKIKTPCLEDFGLTEEIRTDIKRLWKQWIVESQNYTERELLKQPDYCAFKALQKRLFDYQKALADYHNKVRRRAEAYWYDLSGWDFETEIARLFEKRNYKADVTKGSGDGGIDIRIFDADNDCWIVQCKNHRKPVGPAVVRELYGVCVHERAIGGVLVASGGFSSSAIAFASDKPLTLIDMNLILAMEANQQVSLRPKSNQTDRLSIKPGK